MYKRCQKVMPPAAARATSLGVVRSEGTFLYTDDGRTILDFASGVAVNALGGKDPRIVQAIEKEMKSMIHVGHNVVYYESYVALAEELVKLTGGHTKVYFSNSGAEANEGAIKLAKYVTRRPAVIAFRNSFHGRTLLSLSVTGSSSAYRKFYEPLVPSIYWAEYAYCYRCPFHETQDFCDMSCLKQFDEMFHTLVDPSLVACMIVEPVQGEGGYIVPPVKFLQGLREICTKHGIALIFDEVQTGFGRTGSLYAYQTFNVEPDILTSAKALGGGIPLSAVIAKEEWMDAWPAGAHGGTFGGNPLACAASLATLKVFQEEDTFKHVRRMGKYLLSRLQQLKEKYPAIIGDVRGIGMMNAIEFIQKNGMPNSALTKQIQEQALQEGLLVLTCGSDHNVIRLMPPLNVKKEEIDMMSNILMHVIGEIVS